MRIKKARLEKLMEKLQLFHECEKVICCADQEVGSRSLLSYMEDLKAQVVSWSLESKANYQYVIRDRVQSHTSLTALLPSGEIDFTLHYIAFALLGS